MRTHSTLLRSAAAFCALAFSFGAGGRASAQYDSDLERPQVGSPSPEGRPPSARPWAPLSYYIWHDGGGWHLRSTTSGHFHAFEGTVQAPDGVYNVRATDPNTPLEIGGNQIRFNYTVQGGERGFDWQGNGPANFSLRIDGRERPEKIRIGYGEQRPYPGGVQLYPGGEAPMAQPVAQVDGSGDPVVAATDDDLSDVQGAEGPEVDPDEFHGVLSPYGEWVTVPGYGTIWRPNGDIVGADFQPYGYGHWADTDLGWTWVSGYDWGWAPFHYGNWVYAEGGWGWIPGRVWAPAWVEWRYGGGYVGWAPCAPYGHAGYVVQPVHYSFVTVNNFNSSNNVRTVVITGNQAVAIHGQTQPQPSVSYVGGHPVVPVHAGPSPTAVAQASGHPVVPVQAASLHAVTPPANQAGVHYANGASAAHPVMARPVPPAIAKQYVAAQPKAAAQAFAQNRAQARAAPAAANGRPIAPANNRPAPTAQPQARPQAQPQPNRPAPANNRPAPQVARPEPQPNRPEPRAEPQQNRPEPRAEPQQNRPEPRAEPEPNRPEPRAEPQAAPHPVAQPHPQAAPRPKPPPAPHRH